MMNSSPETPREVLEVIKPNFTRGLFGIGKVKITVPKAVPGVSVLHMAVGVDGQRKVEPLLPADTDRQISGDPFDLFIAVRCDPLPCGVSLVRVYTDSSTGFGWDVTFEGDLEVSDPKRFADAVKGLSVVGIPLLLDRLAVWVGEKLKLAVSDLLAEKLAGDSFQNLRRDGVLPPGWWFAKLAGLLEPHGLRFSVRRVVWDSAEDSRATDATREREEQELHRVEALAKRKLIEEAAADEQKCLVIQARQQAELASVLAGLEAEKRNREGELLAVGMANEDRLKTQTNEFARRHGEAVRRLMTEELEGAERLAGLRRMAELRVLEHEETVARRRADLEEEMQQRAELQRQRCAREVEHERVLAQQDQDRGRLELEKAQRDAQAAADLAEKARLEKERAEEELRLVKKRRQTFDERPTLEESEGSQLLAAFLRLMAVVNPAVLAQALSKDPREAFQAAGWLTKAGKVSASDLRKLGLVTRQEYVELFDGAGVVLKNRCLCTRDLGAVRMRDTSAHPLKRAELGAPPGLQGETLEIGKPADFELVSSMSGYLTLINLGTSGRIWLSIPNAYRSGPRVEARRSYRVPGDELMPHDALRSAGIEYLENGPEGWEYQVAMVSDQPVVDPSMLKGVHPREPFAELRECDLRIIRDRLDRLGSARWVSTVVGFLVVPPI